MKRLLEKMVALERDISRKKGDFSFFALFVRENSPDHLDLVAAAPWLKDNERKIRSYFAKELQSRLDPQEVLALSGLIFLGEDDPKLVRVQRNLAVEHGLIEVKDEEFFGMGMKRAYIITSKHGNQVAPVKIS